MAQWLRVLAALKRTQVQVPTPMRGNSQLPVNIAPNDASGILMYGCSYEQAPTLSNTYTYN